MPELAEVELARRQWATAHGQHVHQIRTHPHAGIFRQQSARSLQQLKGTQLTSSRSHGKKLFFTFPTPTHPPRHLEVHLGMSGRLHRAAPHYTPERHDHLLLRLDTTSLSFHDYRTFGKVLLHSTEPWRTLPPQPTDSAFTIAHLQRLLTPLPKRPLKALLLNQSIFPGIGNWMADEICWKLRLAPQIPASQVDLAALRRATRAVCFGALRHVTERNDTPQTTGFSPGSYVPHVPPPTWLFQHRWKKGGHCPRCHHTLARGSVASRTTAWCPQCQPTP